MVRKMISGQLDINILLAFIFGTIFISVMLVFTTLIPNPSNFTQWVFVVVTALAGAGIGAVIPGILKVEMPYIEAGGALAIFLLVFLNKPVLVENLARFDPPEESAAPTAIEYLEKVDSGDLDSAWSSLDPEAKLTVARDRAAYNSAYANGRLNLGEITSRTMIGTQEVTNPNGFPAGIYRVIGYRSRFSSTQCYFEQVMLRSAEDKIWRPYEHSINPSPIPCE